MKNLRTLKLISKLFVFINLNKYIPGVPIFNQGHDIVINSFIFIYIFPEVRINYKINMSDNIKKLNRYLPIIIIY